MLDFCPLAVELLKHQTHLLSRNILIEPEWHYENPQADTLVLTDRNKRYQLRFSRETWNRYREFRLTRQMGPDGYHYRADLLTNEPIQIHKSRITPFWNAEATPSFEMQEFAQEVYRMILEIVQSYLRTRNQYNQDQTANSV